MQSIRQYIYVGKKIDEQLEQKVYAIEATDPEKARIIKEEMLFYVRQKNTDFLTQLAVNVQGYLALDTIRRNNLELIKGVDRATTTTISALRTAVVVAQAMTNQKLVLDQITALNKTTSSFQSNQPPPCSSSSRVRFMSKQPVAVSSLINCKMPSITSMIRWT